VITLCRKVYIDEEYKYINLYKTLGKLGTHGTTIFYLFEAPEVGKIIKCFHDGNGENLTDDNLMYRKVYSVFIDDIRESDYFIFVSLM
jgi:hypothetical protein